MDSVASSSNVVGVVAVVVVLAGQVCCLLCLEIMMKNNIQLNKKPKYPQLVKQFILMCSCHLCSDEWLTTCDEGFIWCDMDPNSGS